MQAIDRLYTLFYYTGATPVKYIFLLNIIALTSCSEVIRETHVAEQVLHDIEVAEVAIEKDLIEPEGCEEPTCHCSMCKEPNKESNG